MKVTCPECNFSSDIPVDKIPANAQLATCPKCQIKFKFRDFEEKPTPTSCEDSDYSVQSNEQPQAYQSTVDEVETETPKQQAPADPEYPTNEQIDAEQQYVQNQEAKPEKNDTDIWQSLGSMKPEEKTTQEHNDFDEEKHIEDNEVPFEHLEKYGFFPGLFLTIKKVLLSPATFFKDMPLAGFIKPLIFFVLLAEFQEICNFIWATAGVDTSIGSDVGKIMNDSMISESLNDGTFNSIMSLFLYPLMLAALSFPLIGMTHIMLMIFGAADRGYQATFRATAYSYAPIIFCVLPVMGDMIGALISVAISIIAYKNIHNTTYMRVVLSMIMPLVLLLVILGFYMNFSQPTI
ncbi:zinc-ribbon domain-containing protein [Maridesulfovibrio hydrothermalis]|uniref:MJ0042 family finger-like domain-containing protein n=1 Tax=Maridesulfovibrio hydrothermalis AM13 = DSM 14728 TaxID=1121451 RepID=L0RHX5_9BACT|nr:zinc-ribbon domain-containing protein [Maridesulfovibrio hydrothermalis]CCO25196.1 conserved membrane protein of unknown function [Maridesulfovibrio hydrothermalis AM13 = DSM 14728]